VYGILKKEPIQNLHRDRLFIVAKLALSSVILVLADGVG
jgi:hypothetical protein